MYEVYINELYKINTQNEIVSQILLWVSHLLEEAAFSLQNENSPTFCSFLLDKRKTDSRQLTIEFTTSLFFSPPN